MVKCAATPSANPGKIKTGSVKCSGLYLVFTSKIKSGMYLVLTLKITSPDFTVCPDQS